MTLHFLVTKNTNTNTPTRFSICNDTITLNNLCSDITEYYSIIRHYKKLIFHEDNYHIGFNLPICLTKHLTYVKFAYEFNHYVLLTKNLIHIYFSYSFDTLIEFSKNLLHISFINYNYLIKMSKQLVTISLSGNCNNLIVLGKNLRTCKITGSFNGQIVLPKNLITFATSYRFNQTICLTARLKFVQIGSSSCSIIETRPEKITLETSSDVPNNYCIIDNLPNGRCKSTIQISPMQKLQYDIIQFNTFSNHLKYNIPSDMKNHR